MTTRRALATALLALLALLAGWSLGVGPGLVQRVELRGDLVFVVVGSRPSGAVGFTLAGQRVTRINEFAGVPLGGGWRLAIED